MTAGNKDAQVRFEDRAGPEFVQCSIAGGNLVAFDDDGESMSPVAPSDYTQVVLTSSTSASLLDVEVPSAGEVAGAVWAGNAEASLSYAEVFRIMFSVLAGTSGGAGSEAINFQDIAGVKDRIKMMVDASGNRTMILALDGS